MRTVLVAALLCSIATAAQATDLRGQWHISAPSKPDYVGEVLIDAERRATWDAMADSNGQPAKFQGYVTIDGPRVELVMTNRQRVTRCICVRKSAETMHCYSVFHDGTLSDGYVLTRVGPGPRKLTSILPSN